MIDPPILCEELKRLLGIASTATLRRQIKAKRVPPPDVKLSHKTRYWYPSTPVKAGLIAGGE